MIRLNVAGFVDHEVELRITIEMLENYPYYKYKNTIIHSVFDNFPYTIWSGGRAQCPHIPFSMTRMRECISFFNSRNIGVYYTYSNTLLEEQHLGDYLCNATLELAHHKLNGVIVHSRLLERHIRRNFPKLKIIRSVTLGNDDAESIRRSQENVDRIVLAQEHNRNERLLRSLDKKRLELLVNSHCAPFCKFRREHYDAISRMYLSYEVLGYTENSDTRAIDVVRKKCCRYNPGGKRGGRRIVGGPMSLENSGFNLERALILNRDDVEKLHDKGITYFKIAGREMLPVTYVLYLAHYLIKPKYQLQFVDAILSAVAVAEESGWRQSLRTHLRV